MFEVILQCHDSTDSEQNIFKYLSIHQANSQLGSSRSCVVGYLYVQMQVRILQLGRAESEWLHTLFLLRPFIHMQQSSWLLRSDNLIKLPDRCVRPVSVRIVLREDLVLRFLMIVERWPCIALTSLASSPPLSLMGRWPIIPIVL